MATILVGDDRAVNQLTNELTHKVGELEEGNRRLTLLIELGQHLVLEENPLRLIETCCRRSREIFGARGAAIGLFDTGRQTLDPYFVSAVDQAEALAAGPLPLGSGFLRDLFTQGQSLRIRNPSRDPRTVGLPAEHPRFRSLLGAVIASPTRVYGALYFADKLLDEDFSVEDERLAVALAAQLATAYESSRRYDEIQDYSRRLQTLSRQLLNAQETERRHVARELHDQLGQVLTVIKMHTMSAQRLAGEAVQPRLKEIQNVVETAIGQVRTLSLDLRPSVLDDFGLGAALEWYLESHRESASFTICLTNHLGEERFPTAVETACFRVAQEALTNASRHSLARQVHIEAAHENGVLRLLVRDNGVGFDVEQARRRASHGASVGLLGMRERVELLGGRFEMISAPGQGTDIRASFTPAREGTEDETDSCSPGR